MSNRLLVFLSLLCPAAGLAQVPDVPAGYHAAASNHRLSPAIFYAIALTESGQSRMTAEFRPWPWTLSIDGEPYFFPTREETRTALLEAIQHGPGQLGVGLFQVEYRFHSNRFDSPGAMLDPYENSRVAAEIFSEGLVAAGGNVWRAIGLFHSTTPDLAEAYRKRVARRLVGLVGSTGYGG
ncbi:MAG: lytic transglycosylase domain-containing protein [Gammaproteobacteria bacterium]|nr:lytic transglycosylase domain-containing protein [Gammaproteobacteria bacterium]MYG68412.1 lytic transglycosylase domain-containing protein [Gammaproteobacteria bacterium]